MRGVLLSVAFLIGICSLPAPAGAADTGSVEGRVALPAGAPAGWSLAGVVVYLAPDGFELPPSPPGRWTVSQKGAAFSPAVVAVSVGDSVDFPNDDDADHNVFSFSPAKKFDLGVYPRGASKTLVFDREGPVLLFCSVHESMSGVVFVAPNRFHALTGSRGTFSIRDVPVGRYRLRTWNTRLPEGVGYVEVRSLQVLKGRAAWVEVPLGAAGPAAEARP